MSHPHNKPLEISLPEWQEIIGLPEVRGAWGLSDESPQEFAERVYGAKFGFASGGPGYVGELYILQGDTLSGMPPLTLGRYNGKLRPV